MTLDKCSEANIDKSELAGLEKDIAEFRCVSGLPLTINDFNKVTVAFSACEGTNQPFLCRDKKEILKWRSNIEIILIARA